MHCPFWLHCSASSQSLPAAVQSAVQVSYLEQ